MAHRLYRLGRFAFDHKWSVVAAWLAVLVVTGFMAVTMSKPMQDSLTIPNTPAEQARAMAAELFAGEPADAVADVTMVIGAPDGSTLNDGPAATAVQRLVDDLQGLPQLSTTSTIADPVQAAEVQTELLVANALENGVSEDRARSDAAAVSPLSADGAVGTVEWSFDVTDAADVSEDTKARVETIAETARSSGLDIGYFGPGMESSSVIDPTSELIGLVVAAVVLIFTFGSLVAAGLPLITAVVGVAIGVLGVVAATAFTDLGSTTPLLATMLGLAVGIDYALFVLSRYRHELGEVSDRREAVGRAVGTAGSSIVFAGATVVIALAALAVVGIPFLTSMGIAAAATVAVAVLIALTLLPALIGVRKKSIRWAHPGRRRGERTYRRTKYSRPQMDRCRAGRTVPCARRRRRSSRFACTTGDPFGHGAALRCNGGSGNPCSRGFGSDRTRLRCRTKCSTAHGDRCRGGPVSGRLRARDRVGFGRSRGRGRPVDRNERCR